MAEIKVSVIVPVYNVEKYLQETLEDITGQTLEDIQIICVDDGSTDDSAQIIREFSIKDTRVQLVSQENKNAGVARNHGMQYADGEYVVFWDADDRFRSDALEILYSQCKKTNADICICRADHFDTETEQHWNIAAFLKEKFLPDQEVFQKSDVPQYIFNITNNVPWNKMYRREFLKEKGLQFQDIKQANDTFFTLCAFFYAKRITTVNDILISYRVNNKQSLSGKASDTVMCAYQSYLKTWEKLKQEEDFPMVKKSFLNRAISGFFHSLNIQTTFSAYKELYDTLTKEGFLTFGLLDMEREDFLLNWHYDDIQAMMRMTPEDFLVKKSMERRLNIQKKNDQIQKLRSTDKEQKKNIKKLNKENETMKKQLQELQNSRSYRLGRVLTKPYRILRKK